MSQLETLQRNLSSLFSQIGGKRKLEASEQKNTNDSLKKMGSQSLTQKIKGPISRCKIPLEGDFLNIFIGPWSLGKPTFCCKP